MYKGRAISVLLVGCFISSLKAGKLHYQQPAFISRNTPQLSYQYPSYAPVHYPSRKTKQWTSIESVPFNFEGGSSKQQEYSTERLYTTPKVKPTPAAAAGGTITSTESSAVYKASSLSKDGEFRHHHHADHHFHHKHKQNHSHHYHHHHHHKQSALNTHITKTDGAKRDQIQFQLNNFLKDIEHKLLVLKLAVFKYARLLDEDSDLQDLDRSLLLTKDDD
uniref:Uncharacterized protein n=1 Tax=Anopheles albimanus TaxID=7167 RepID=A0A8W7K791_ANOAL